MEEQLWLVHYGVPYDVAFSLDPTYRLAYLIILGEAESNHKWDWGSMKWREKR